MRARAACVAAVVALAAVLHAAADETDQFTMPTDRPMADLGDYLDTVHCRALEGAVGDLNDEVRRALAVRDAKDREAALARVNDPAHVVERVESRFGSVASERDQIERSLREAALARANPDRIVAYIPPEWIYAHIFPAVDLRWLAIGPPSSTIRAYGVCFGTDKIVHFHRMGRTYYSAYTALLADGVAPDLAMAMVVRRYAAHDVLSERDLLGFWSSGVYSNADLAADYMGFMFCQNITRPVTLKGHERPPLLVRHGEFWRVNSHVRPESGWFGWFVSDHWNEALNPSWFEHDIHDKVRAALGARAGTILTFYTEIDHRPADPAYFEVLAHELSSIDGVDYGHSRNWDRLITIADICWPRRTPPGPEPVAHEAN